MSFRFQVSFSGFRCQQCWIFQHIMFFFHFQLNMDIQTSMNVICDCPLYMVGPCKGGDPGILDSNFKRTADSGFKGRHCFCQSIKIWIGFPTGHTSNLWQKCPLYGCNATCRLIFWEIHYRPLSGNEVFPAWTKFQCKPQEGAEQKHTSSRGGVECTQFLSTTKRGK